jgi:pyruvate,water dikinase
VRSSFTGEDRPNKSAAGQYDSFPNVLSARQRLEAIAGVIASAWNEEAVKTNREMGVDSSLIWPAVVIQPCLDAQKSGVAFSRGPNGALGVVGYQAKRGFGGGVEGGAAEEGIVDRRQASQSAILTGKQQRTLFEAVQEIEREFDRSIEPGAHHAVDVEWVIADRALHVVQARTIGGF